MESSGIESKSVDARAGAIALLSSLGLRVDCDTTCLACETQQDDLPPGWSQHVDDFGVAFFYNQFSDESTWVHPRSEMLVELYEIVKRVKDKQDPSSKRLCRITIEEHLASVQLRAAEEIRQWAGPYMHSGEAYYYNILTHVTSWVSPVEMWEDELRSRAQVLSGCLLRDASKRDKLSPRLDIPGTSRESSSALLAAMHAHGKPSIVLDQVSIDHDEERLSNLNDSCTYVSISSPSQGDRCVQRMPQSHRDSALVTTSEICTDESRVLVPASSHCLHSETEVLIHTFHNDPNQSVLEFPPTLSAKERKSAKALADRYNGLRCESFGYGTDRQLLIFKDKGASNPGNVGTVATDACVECLWASLEDFTFGKAEPLSISDCQAITMGDVCDTIVLEDLTPKFGKSSSFDIDSPQTLV